MRGLTTSLLVSALLMGAGLKAGCGHASLGQVAGETVTAAEITLNCGGQAVQGGVIDDVRNAIHLGSTGWLSAAIDAGRALWCIVKAELAAHGCTFAAADAAPVCPAGLSPQEAERIRFLLALLKVTQSVQLPPGAVK